MPPTLHDVVQPALANLRSRYLAYLRNKIGDAEKTALDILRSPPRTIGLREQDLAQSRLLTVRTGKIGICLEQSLLLFAYRHEGCTVDLRGPAAINFVLERPRDRIVAVVQSRASTENWGTQAVASQNQLLAQRNDDKTTHLLRCFVAEYGVDREYARDQHGVHLVNGPLAFHWFSGDRECWSRLVASIDQLLRARDIRQAELNFRSAIEHALIGLSDHRIQEADYERSRYHLEQVLGPCAPVLMEQAPATQPPNIFDLVAEIEEGDAND